MDNPELKKDIIQWDIDSWATALSFWEQTINWNQISTCLELGGREGGLSLWLGLKGKTVICSDLNNTKSTAEKLHQKYKITSIQYQDIDATNIPYENHFDLIVFKSIIGGIGRNDDKEKQRRVFQEIFKALKPGGSLLFAENLKASPFHWLFRKLFNKWSSYWRYLDVKECQEFLKDYQLTEIKTTGFLATFGRTENQKKTLAAIDRLISPIIPKSWNYIVYGVSKK